VRSIVQEVARPIRSYGLETSADVRATRIRPAGLQTHFEVTRTGDAPLAVTLNLPGAHNVRNALAAIAVASELGIEDAAIQRALASFQGVDRRLQLIGDALTGRGPVTIVDDYGHHPTEVAATLEAIRQAYPGRRVVLAFQPHRYSRTHVLIDDFARALSAADVLCVTEVYAAGEPPIPGADGRALCRAVRSRGAREPIFVEKVEELAAALKDVVQGGDVVVAMGAGNISAVAHSLPQALAGYLPPGRAA
jgi:UDP-N-acetylmuramate--alanine ligase